MSMEVDSQTKGETKMRIDSRSNEVFGGLNVEVVRSRLYHVDGCAHKSTLIFVNGDTFTLDAGEGLVGDIGARKSIKENRQIKKALLAKFRDFLGEQNNRNLVVRFNKMAGCSVCPCSPGYILRGADSSFHGFAFWVNITATDADNALGIFDTEKKKLAV